MDERTDSGEYYPGGDRRGGDPIDLTFDDAVTRTSARAVKSSGIWAAVWGALAAVPTGFASLYDWCVEKLKAKRDKTDFTVGDGWILVEPEPVAGRIWMKWDARLGCYVGEGYALYREGTSEITWTLNKTNPIAPIGLVVTAPDVVKLTVPRGINPSEIYSLYRGTRLAFDTEIPPSRVAASGGADTSLVTTGEKYRWNNKVDFAKLFASNGNIKYSLVPSYIDMTDEWASSKWYEKFSVVLHDNTLYYCDTAHTSGAEWDDAEEAHWRPTTIKTELDSKRDGLDLRYTQSY